MASWAIFRGLGLLFYLLLGSRKVSLQKRLSISSQHWNQNQKHNGKRNGNSLDRCLQGSTFQKITDSCFVVLLDRVMRYVGVYFGVAFSRETTREEYPFETCPCTIEMAYLIMELQHSSSWKADIWTADVCVYTSKTRIRTCRLPKTDLATCKEILHPYVFLRAPSIRSPLKVQPLPSNT